MDAAKMGFYTLQPQHSGTRVIIVCDTIIIIALLQYNYKLYNK